MDSASPWTRSFLRRSRLALTCCSIVANGLFAGGIFMFPILSPALVSHLKLTQPQLTTIVLAGIAGQYPFAAIVGKVIDHYGPWACSLIASLLFSAGFGLFSLEIAKTPDDISKPSETSFHHLVIYFGLAGLGTVFSLFSFLFSASKAFPNYLGIASGTSMALFGLSPLFLSYIGSNFFSDPDTDLDVTCFLKFLAIASGIVHLLGGFALKLPTNKPDEIVSCVAEEDSEQGDNPNERSALLPGKSNVTVDVHVVPSESDGSVLDLLRDPHFWVLALVVLITLGSCEMLMSNIGTIVLSLPPSSSSSTILLTRSSSTDLATSTQVRLMSLSNTITRILSGSLADFVSPIAPYLPTGARSFSHKHRISRIAFLSASTLLLAVLSVWMETRIRSQGDLFVLSIGVGIVYGAAFTILPSIISSIWGMPNFGRNLGVITYAPFLGTPFFSYLYAFISASHSLEGGVCEGISCWQFTFWFITGSSLLAFCASLVLWKRWKGLV